MNLLEIATTWYSLPLGALVFMLTFGFAPVFILRVLVLVYPKSDARRRELVAELYALGRLERLLFVGEQLGTVLMDGVPARVKYAVNGIKVRLPWLWVDSMTVKTARGYSTAHFGRRCFRWSPHVLQTRRVFGAGIWEMWTQRDVRRERQIIFNGSRWVGRRPDYSQDGISARDVNILNLLNRLQERPLQELHLLIFK